MRPYYINDELASEPLAPIRGREGVYSILLPSLWCVGPTGVLP